MLQLSMTNPIRPVNVITTDIAREIAVVSKQNSIADSKLYIKINHITTFVKKSNSDFLEMSHEDLNEYKQEVLLRDESIEFKQEYDIDINSQDEDYTFANVISEIEFQENDTSAYFIIKKGSKLKYYDELYNDFLSYITEQKLRSGILIHLFEVNYQESIKDFVDVIEKIKKITFKDDKKILISKGFNEIISLQDEICMTIEDKSNIGAEDAQGRVDYSNRGFLLSCSKGEELFHFIKPFQGQHGRTCRGDIIEVETVNMDAKPTFTVEDNIEVEDSFENIKYLSNKSGYLVKEGDKYHVSNSIDIDEISFKTTGTINSDLDSEISINVIKDNPLEDAVEEGMHVKVQQLSIQGSIGPDTMIEARDVTLNGQTHKDSVIQCVNANIGLHKGKITGRTVEVETLEGGEIIADTAIIKNAVRGKIRAKCIEIEILGSHVIMEASEYIQIEKTKGEENKFIIDSLFDSGFDNDKKDDKAYLEKVKDELTSLLKSFKDATTKLKNNLEQCKKIKVAIIQGKEKGIQISQTLIKNFKICKVMQVHYKKLKEEVEYKKSQYENLNNKLTNDSSNILTTQITLSQPINGYNHILYKLSKPKVDISLYTDETMRGHIFKLQEDEDGILKIVNTNN